ncbi:hypothetical protein OKW21_001528 [Catalinimonas alkaloidigena]|uniref:hypothetical protein n=1 Tax=Catalinimonas alkaloidigena TaxID=1075417 RepID=UPI002406D2F9|nr:hypothetical protein [Catalinimonas alkaloidigena]MDF9796265.1 hypothetical protein [Catalinimonas alkaloidigena]
MIRYSLIFILLLVTTFSYSQDTIYVSNQSKSYLLFDEAVSLADIGNPMLFQASIEGKAIMVIAKKDSVPPTPFYAVVGDQPFQGVLIFHSHPQVFYDFRKDVTEHEKSIGNEIEKRFKVLNEQADLFYVGNKADGISFKLVGILHDHQATYLKFRVKNHTSVIYHTEFIGFERLKKYKKGLFAKMQVAHFPIAAEGWQIKEILPYSSANLYYVLPLQALERKESIIATLREKAARRSVPLKLPYQLIKRANLY